MANSYIRVGDRESRNNYHLNATKAYTVIRKTVDSISLQAFKKREVKDICIKILMIAAQEK